MREIYDGSWIRPFGSGGGTQLRWEGKLGFLAGVTPEIDNYSSIITQLGDRFVLLRLPDADPLKMAEQALINSKDEKAMRKELAEVMVDLINSADQSLVNIDLSKSARDDLGILATYVARARTGIDRDRNGIPRVLPQPEGTARLVKVFRRLYGGLAAIGLEEPYRWLLVRRVARDCVPAMRNKAIEALLTFDPEEQPETSAFAERAGMVPKTARHYLEGLELLGMVEHEKSGDRLTAVHRWQATEWLRDYYSPKQNRGARTVIINA